MPPASATLIRLPNPLGDAVMATPMLRALRTALPKEQLVVAGNPAFESLLEGLDSFDAFLPLPRGRGMGRVLREARALKSAEARRILLLTNSWSSALAARLASIPERVGRGNRGRGFLLNTALPPAREPRPMTEIYMELVPDLDIPPGPVELARPPNTEPGSFLGVAPGAAFGPSKIYPVALLAAAVRRAVESTGLSPRILGAPEESALLAELADRLEETGIVLDSGSGPCSDLADARLKIAECRVLLCMDSGARHIAAALGVPQVALYGPTHPAWTAHGTEGLTSLRRTLAEVPCLAGHKARCPIDHPCMEKISPGEVAEAILETLT